MNLGENRFEKERKEALDAMGLTKENRRLADQWMDMEEEENPKLLKLMRLQDFFGRRTGVWANSHYLGNLKKHGRAEELSRFVQMAAATGGAAARCFLITPDYDRWEEILSYLTGENAREQAAAIRASAYAVGIYLRKPSDLEKLFEIGRKEPEVLLRAMKGYCKYEESAWRILAGAYLHVTEPGQAEDVAGELVDSLLKTIPNMGRDFTTWDLERMEAYVRNPDLDSPFPDRVFNICWEKGNPAMNTGVWGACAFLAVLHSPCLEKFLRLMVGLELRYSSRGIVLSCCMNMTGEEWFHQQMDRVEDMLPMEEEPYVLWCVNQRCGRTLARLAEKYPDAVEKTAEKCTRKDYEYIMGELKKGDLALYEKMRVTCQRDWQEKWAKEMVSRIYPGREEAKQYLLGQTMADVLLPFAEEWGSFPDLFGAEERGEEIQAVWNWGNLDLYRRAVVLEAFLADTIFFETVGVNARCADTAQEVRESGIQKLAEPGQIQLLLAVFYQEQLSLSCQIHLLAGLGEGIRDKRKKQIFWEQCRKAFSEQEPVWSPDEWEDGLGKAVREGSSWGRRLGLQVLDFVISNHREASNNGRDPVAEMYRKQLFSAAGNGPKQVQKTLLEVLAGHREWEPEILGLLASKKASERELAIGVLEEWGGCSCPEKVREAVQGEKSKKLKQRLEELVSYMEENQKFSNGQEKNGPKEGENEWGKDGPGETGRGRNRPGETGFMTPGAMDRLAAELSGFGKKRKVEWTKNISFPKLHRRNGTETLEDYRTAIFAAYADMDLPGIHSKASQLAAELDEKDLSDSVSALLEYWLDAGAEAKKRWVLYAAAIYGGEAMVPVLCRQIDLWLKQSRGVMAAEATRALVLGGSREALLWADQASRSFPSRQVRKAAGEALLEAAKAMGIRQEELEDRIVPTLGFDRNREQIFDYGTRSFRAVLSLSFGVEIFDEKGKRFEKLPAPGKKDDPAKASEAYERFKKMKKELKRVSVSQRQRLELALLTKRLWTAKQWKALFVENPVMNPFAQGLIWGMYEGGILQDTFRYMEDGSFNSPWETEAVVSEKGLVGLVHPSELSEEILEKWKEQLSDYEVLQPFCQIHRPVYRQKKEEMGEYQLVRFQEKTVNSLSLAGKMLRQGWMRGPVEEGGFYHSFCRRDGEMGAELEFSGTLVGAEMEDVTIGGLRFYQWAAGGGKTERKNCTLGEVETRYFSEVVKMVEEV